jgi:hypothetical protein
MALNWTLWLALAAYVGCFVIFIYVCIIADTETSQLARYVNETLPDRVWSWLSKRVSKRTLYFVQFFSDRFLLLIYCTVVYGAWSILFWLIYPWISHSNAVSNVHKAIGYAVFATCVTSWRLATSTSPGIITARTLERYDHFPYDNLLFDENRKCQTTGIPKIARSKFDRHKYNANVARFDHFCGWVHNTIGEENYRFFLLFLLVHFGMCTYGALVVWWLFVGEVQEKKLLELVYVDRFTGEEVPASKFIVAQYLFNRYLWEAGLFMLMAVMAVALFFFLMYHVYLTSYGMTTNESYKWGYINTWYKRELRRYKDAAKNSGRVSERLESSDEPRSDHKRPRDAAQHPGPPPVNIYDRGFIENWNEVVFPISLRRSSRTTKDKAS